MAPCSSSRGPLHQRPTAAGGFASLMIPVGTLPRCHSTSSRSARPATFGLSSTWTCRARRRPDPGVRAILPPTLEAAMSQATATKPSIITDAPIHPSLAASDLARARAWYADKLGWEPTIEPPGVLVYELGPASAFTIYETPFAGTAKNTVMNWAVPDVGDAVARLR